MLKHCTCAPGARDPLDEVLAQELDGELERRRAQDWAEKARQYAEAAAASETAAAASAKAADESKAIVEADAESAVDAAEAAVNGAAAAVEAAKTAGEQAEDARNQALVSKSWAVDGTGIREGEGTDNARYYAGQARESEKSAAGSVQVLEENAGALQAVRDNLAAIQDAAENALAAQAAAESSAADAERAEAAAKLAQSIGQGAQGYYPTADALRKAHETGEDGQWAIVGETDTIWVWDSDSSAWTDSGNKTDLSQYYTKAEADAELNELQKALTQATDEKMNEQQEAITQETDGKLAEKLDKDAAAEAAKKLESPRSIQTDLASSASALFDGSMDVTPGVTGVLPVTNGGTGMDSIPKLYNVIGLLATGTNTGDAVRGYGFAEVIEYPKGFFKIIFHLQIEVAGTTASAIGVDSQEISKAIGRTIIPAGLGTGLYFDANGAVSPSINGYGIVLTPVSNRWWMVSRMYSTAGNIGGWGGTLFPKGVRLYGEVFGVAN